jgi:hypothetical protein
VAKSLQRLLVAKRCRRLVSRPNKQEHAYLKGMHKVELHMKDYTCASTFQIRIYRIR